MKFFLCPLLILGSMFFISCKEYPLPDPSEIPSTENPYKPEIDLPKEIQITGEYILTKGKESLQFNSEDEDWYCYYSLLADSRYPDEDIIPIRFRLYSQDNKLLRESLPKVQRSFIEEKGFTEKVTVWTYIPYHKDGVKIKAILVDDEGKDLKVLDERGILAPEEFRERSFHNDCYREVGFRIE